MSIKELYTKGTRIWLPDATEVWRSATLIDNYNGGDAIKVQLQSGQKVKVKVHSETSLPHLRNPEVLIGENDLTSLSYLHEPAVLHNLQVRFCERNNIYTYCGIVLVAINPYQQMPLYGLDTIHAYSGQDMASMDPHIFALAEEAFKRMSRFDENQSIIVSGESGAGKTVSAKYAMRYFSTLCGARDESEIEKRVLATNPIMEALGNAKTTRNDNSSRFGKFIEISFSKDQKILGANLRTYLLEKSRVVSQAVEERNYHIFYQLCSAADDPSFKQYLLDSPDEFHYTCNDNSSTVDSINDPEDFLAFCQALSLMGLSQSKQSQMFRVLSGILHLGNVAFHATEKASEEGSQILNTDRYIATSSKLLGVDGKQLRYWLCNKKMVTAGEVLSVPLSPHQASSSRDALSKHIYAQLFLWLIRRLNGALEASVKSNHFIGVLDIYGFESFERNSFEQFCINYANEKLQQQFCLHVFKLEQEEYVKEGIAWSFIDFHDNQACIALIEDKLGILDLLHEECKMVNGSDENWCRKLYDRHSKHAHFSKPRMSQEAFIIHHFADDVEYEIEGFLEKNRDKVLEEHINIFKASEYELVAELFQEEQKDSKSRQKVTKSSSIQPNNKLAKQHAKTVGSQFSESLGQLMKTLFSTTPHYVRCIKPNDFKQPLTFDAVRSVQQLRACGVLETVRISAAGYPSRWTYQDFYRRYRVLAHSSWVDRKNLQKTCNNLINNIISNKDMFQFGKTKIFFRAGQVAYLERLRADKLKTCSVKIQKVVRGWLCRRRWNKIRKMVAAVQTRGRGLLARREAQRLRRNKAATRIACCWKGCRERKKYLRVRASAVFVQTMARSMLARRKYMEMTSLARIVCIQRHVRTWVLKRKCRKVMVGVVKMQGLVRKMLAKRLLKKLKAEAKSSDFVNKKALGLENKIIQMQQKLDDKNKEVVQLRQEQEENKELRREVCDLRMVSKDVHVTASHVGSLQEEVEMLRRQVEEERSEKERLKVEKEKMKQEKNDLINSLNAEREMLKGQIETVSQELKAHVENQEDVCSRRVEEATKMLQHDLQMERSSHQRLVKEHTRVQQRLDNLQSDHSLMGTPRLKRHRRSPSNVSEFSVESGSSAGERNDVDSGISSVKKTLLQEENELSSIAEKTLRLEKKEVPLALKLQARLRELETKQRKVREEASMREFPFQDAIINNASLNNVYEAFKLQEMEIENASIRNQLSRLQKVLTESASNYDVKGGKTKQLYDQFEALKEELRHKHNEAARLKTLLFKTQQQVQQLSNNNSNTYSTTASEGSNLNVNGEEILLNEDGELSLAYESQKKLNQLLEGELQRSQEISRLRSQDLLTQIEALKKANSKQEKLLHEIAEGATEVQVEAVLVQEVARVTEENLDLNARLSAYDDTSRKLKKAVSIYSKRLKASEVTDANMELERELARDEGLPSVKYLEQREWNAMLECRKEDQDLLMKNLILDLRAEVMLKEMPHLPSYLLLLLVRHHDFLNEDERVDNLFNSTFSSIKKVIKRHQTDLGRMVAWLANSVRLLNNLKQYSGDELFQGSNTARQNEQCLKNFDLSDYMHIVNDMAVWIYQTLLKLVESKIQNHIVGALLEREQVSGCGTEASSDCSSRPSSTDDLIKVFDQLMQHLCAHNVDSDVISQFFKQIFYFMCATSMNTLLLRKDLCRWTKAVQIRYNISQLEQWVRDNKMHDDAVIESLTPLIQATQLLQARKTEADVDSVCDVACKLTLSQIVKLLNLYTPVDDFEEKVPLSLIRRVQERLTTQSQDQEGVPEPGKQSSLMMDIQHQNIINFNFVPSSVALEQIKIPTAWGLGFLRMI